ncbi:hypothetical protein V6N12_038031 [Hibiscus sabdariffa]|uniref:NB-ARC domain-containing protein n=1 Tax=Hibiscus sabdariffa TaxID=183260 RepID=A0ABR2BWD1_9ROSI
MEACKEFICTESEDLGDETEEETAPEESATKGEAFGNSPISPELEAIGKDIAHRCGGVPLVAAVIGGTM